MKRLRRAVLAGLLGACALLLGAAAPTTGATTLRSTFGGVLLEAHLLPRGAASLTGVWADKGHARLMKCAPRCVVIPAIPLSGPLTVSQDSTYRVVLGGTFKPGQRVKVLLRFDASTLITVEAAVVAR